MKFTTSAMQQWLTNDQTHTIEEVTLSGMEWLRKNVIVGEFWMETSRADCPNMFCKLYWPKKRGWETSGGAFSQIREREGE